MADPAREKHSLSFERASNGSMTIRIEGEWRLHHGMPSAGEFQRELAQGLPRLVVFEGGALARWDSSLLAFVTGVDALCKLHDIEADRSRLPVGLRRLLELAETVPAATDAERSRSGQKLLERIGLATIGVRDSGRAALTFLGQVLIALANFAGRRARYRRTDLIEVVQQCGANALGIVTLISYLVGVILAFMGAVQLQQFGASIYVADLVAIGIVRDMGAMMTGIIMSGRTGAAFAAQLGTMKVTEEIDALATMGISPLEFLVVPRVLALVLMMPLLCVYSDFVGIVGGATVGAGMLGISPLTYARETAGALRAYDLLGGLLKSGVYGVLIAFAGCWRGFECANSSSAVGDAATEAVVLSIVMIVVACGIFAVVFNILGI